MTGDHAPYGLNIGAFIEDYGSRWVVLGGPGGFGYAAQRRSDDGVPRGPKYTALGLDQLAEVLDREEAQPCGAP